MKTKTTKILFWTVTTLFAAFMLMAGIVEAIQHESGKEIMTHLGYPFHVLTVLGIGKILGAIAIMQTKFRTIKEWAYAGFTFNFIGACVARASANDGFGLIISPLIFLVFMFASYFLWEKNSKKPINGHHMETYNWYQKLIKPNWAPPASVFGPVWTFLYLLITISFGKVFLMAWAKEIPTIIILPFILNLVFNFAFTPIQFGLRNNFLASLDILLVLATLIWAMIAIWPHLNWITYIQIPYLLWVAFATVLQFTITYLNK